MRLDDVVQIEDFSNETLLGLAQRLEQSESFEHLILREMELDEIWRRVDAVMTREQNAGSDVDGLERVRKLVFEAHDLAADGNPREAANRLRQAMNLQEV